MLKFSLTLFTVFCLILKLTNGQSPDQGFCNRNKPPLAPVQEALPQFDINTKYEMHIERNRADRQQTEEIQEFYDGTANLGVSVNLFAGVETRSYSYYESNQVLIVKDLQCAVYDLDRYIELTDFYVTTVNGKPHIVNAVGLLLLNPGIKFDYLGDQNVIRGIPVMEWQTCFYSDNKKATLKMTISLSNPNLWSPALFATNFTQFPVQIKTESKNSQDGTETIEFDVITQFRPNSALLNTDRFNTPSGVYCPDRIQGKELQFKPPNAFSATLHIANSAQNQDGYAGQLSVNRIDVDYDKQLARYDFFDDGYRYTDIHDFDTGLSYKTNRFTGKCEITKLDSSMPEAHNAYDFFQFNIDPPLQYVGHRRARGIGTDVYITKRIVRNIELILEYYFMADGWTVQEANDRLKYEPIQLLIQANQPGLENTPTTISVFNFDRTRVNYFDFGVSQCDLNKRVLGFKIDSIHYSTMKQNQENVRLAILFQIQKITTLSWVRIAQLEVIYDYGYAYPTFTLLEMPTLIGNPNRTTVDISLIDALSKLNSSINNKQFSFSFNDQTGRIYSVGGNETSALVSYENSGSRNSIDITDEENAEHSNGILAGVAIGFTLLGLVVGLIGGVFLILRKKTTNVPI